MGSQAGGSVGSPCHLSSLLYPSLVPTPQGRVLGTRHSRISETERLKPKNVPSAFSPGQTAPARVRGVAEFKKEWSWRKSVCLLQRHSDPPPMLVAWSVPPMTLSNTMIRGFSFLGEWGVWGEQGTHRGDGLQDDSCDEEWGQVWPLGHIFLQRLKSFGPSCHFITSSVSEQHYFSIPMSMILAQRVNTSCLAWFLMAALPWNAPDSMAALGFPHLGFLQLILLSSFSDRSLMHLIVTSEHPPLYYHTHPPPVWSYAPLPGFVLRIPHCELLVWTSRFSLKGMLMLLKPPCFTLQGQGFRPLLLTLSKCQEERLMALNLS